MQAIIAGLIRHVMTTFGGGLVASGVLSGEDLSAAIGAVVTLFGVVWSIVAKQRSA